MTVYLSLEQVLDLHRIQIRASAARRAFETGVGSRRPSAGRR